MLRHVNHSVATRIGLALATVILTFCTVGTVQAQTTYVGASAVVDIARFGSAGVEDSCPSQLIRQPYRSHDDFPRRPGATDKSLQFTRPLRIVGTEAYRPRGILVSIPPEITD